MKPIVFHEFLVDSAEGLIVDGEPQLDLICQVLGEMTVAMQKLEPDEIPIVYIRVPIREIRI